MSSSPRRPHRPVPRPVGRKAERAARTPPGYTSLVTKRTPGELIAIGDPKNPVAMVEIAEIGCGWVRVRTLAPAALPISRMSHQQLADLADQSPKQEPAAQAPGTPAAHEQPDRLYADAIAIVHKFGYCSCSLLQRKLGLGFTAASQLIDRMVIDGQVVRDSTVHPWRCKLAQGGAE